MSIAKSKECKKIEIINWNELQKPQLFINGDCMEYMKTMPDNYAELAICDPPYGIDFAKTHTGEGWVIREPKAWDKSIPNKEYFTELFRISKNQIIWGGNYFTEYLKPSMGWILWDKGQRDFSLADGELAWTSYNKALRIFNYSRANLNKSRSGFHPTEKPIKLYEWLLTKYAHPGDKILDTHVGSASSLIACHNLHYDYIGFELDADYYRMASERLEAAKSQMKLL